MNIEAVVFDAYGTLFDVHSVMQRCESCWPGKGAQLSQLWRAKQLEYTWQRSLMSRYQPFSTVMREALACACETLRLELSVPQALEKMNMARKAILTNGSPDMIEPLVKNSGFKFDAVLSVDALKIYQPAPQVYKLAVKKLRVAKENIGFVSSNCWDALGAKSYGFSVYWLNPIGSLSELREILR